MAEQGSRKLFLNLAVRDLDKSKAFFAALGFQFNPKFTDENAACMIVGEDAYVMLLVDTFFNTFTKRQQCDTTKQTEGLFAFSCNSREEVDEVMKKALAGGATPAMDPQDHGFMYSHSFYDIDGHHWEPFWMQQQ